MVNIPLANNQNQGSNQSLPNKRYEKSALRDFENQPTLSDFLKYGGLIHASILFKREILDEHKYNENFYRAEDREFFLKIIKKYNVHRINLPLYFIREFNFLNYTNMLTGYNSEYRAIVKHGKNILNNRFILIYYKFRIMLKIIFLYFFDFLGLLQSLSYKKMGIYNDNFYHLDEIVNKNKNNNKEIKRSIV